MRLLEPAARLKYWKTELLTSQCSYLDTNIRELICKQVNIKGLLNRGNKGEVNKAHGQCNA